MIDRILPPPVMAAESFGDIPGAALFPAEHAVVANEVPGRRREFATGRVCARAALARLGRLPPVAVPRGPGGAPRWPEGTVGSITHCEGYRAAAVASTRDVVSLGIDAEPNVPLPNHGMLGLISSRDERARLRELAAARPGVNWDRLLFSAKESVYKTWFSVARRWLGFESADIVIDASAGTFAARLLVPGPIVNESPLALLDGRWLSCQGLLMTSVALATA